MDTEQQTFLKAKIFKTVEVVSKYTCQLYYDGAPNPLGTAVCVKDGDFYFLISAAHVVESEVSSLWVRTGGNKILQILIEDQLVNKTDNRSKDKIDIAVLKLHQNCAKDMLNFYDFLDIKHFGINRKDNWNPMLFGLGYPATLTKQDYKTKAYTSEKAFIQLPPEDLDQYSKYDINSKANILLKYPKKNMFNFGTDVKGTGPDVYGMSGCGLWEFYGDTTTNSFEFKLVGILTEWHKQYSGHIIATRIDIVSEILRNTYNSAIPVSMIYPMSMDIEDV